MIANEKMRSRAYIWAKDINLLIIKGYYGRSGIGEWTNMKACALIFQGRGQLREPY